MSDPTAEPPPSFRERLSPHLPILRFIGLFVLSIAVLLGVSYTTWFEQTLMKPYLAWSAEVGSMLLDLLGFETEGSGRNIVSPSFSIEIKRGCDAYEPTAIFLSALVAFPAAARAKVLGALLGTLLLVALNFVRIVTLFWIGARHPDFFDAAHVEVWQALFILVSLGLFLVWAVRVTGPPPERRGAPT